MTVLADLRTWWSRRNDPPPMLPDPVVWTVRSRDLLTAESPQQTADRYNATEDHTHKGGDKWRPVGIVHSEAGSRPVLRRTDGAYRWRHDSLNGF